MTTELTSPLPDGSRGRRFWKWVAGAVVVSVMLRAPFVRSPISTDEGGYLAIARAWRHGLDPYRDVWVDRPQGVLLLYRWWDVLWPDGEDWVRIISLVLGAMAVVAVASVARTLGGHRSGIVGACVTAAVSAHPLLEGFAANGELLAGSFSAACVAVAAPAMSTVSVQTGRRRLVAAGAVGAVAFSMKQTGVDGPLAVATWLVVASVAAGDRSRLRSLGWFVGGAAVVLVPLFAHGWWVGGERYRYALWGYRLEGRSAVIGANWGRLLDTGSDAALVLVPVVAAIAASVLLGPRRRLAALRSMSRSPRAVIAWWVMFAVLAFLAGGQFFHHYWVSISFPLAAVAGLTLPRLRREWSAVAVGAVLLVSVASTALLATIPDERAPRPISLAGNATSAEPVGDWLRANAAKGSNLFVMCVGPHLYAHAGLDPAYPFLWLDGIRTARGSQELLEETFVERPPSYVVMFQDPSLCTDSDVVTDVLATHYEWVAVVERVAILRLVSQS